MVDFSKAFPERTTVKLKEFITAKPRLLSLVFDATEGLKHGKGKFGDYYILTVGDSENKEYTMFLTGKEKANVFGKTLVEMFVGKEKGFQFLMSVSERTSKDGKPYKLYVLDTPDGMGAMRDGVQRLVNQVKKHNMKREAAILFAKKLVESEQEMELFLEMFDGTTPKE